MSCCRPLKICNNTARVSARRPRQEPQRRGRDRVVRRLSITHRDHIWAKVCLDKWTQLVSLSAGSTLYAFHGSSTFPCRRPCRGVEHHVWCVWARKRRQRNGGWEQWITMIIWITFFIKNDRFRAWSFTFLKYSQDHQEERSQWGTSYTIWCRDCQFPSEYHCLNSKYNNRKQRFLL